MIVLATVSGCGSQAAQPRPVVPVLPLVQVAIAEDSVNLGAGETHQFTATVTGTSNTAVTWSLSGCAGAACGTLSSTGLYTAPSPIPAEATITVTGTSQADSTKFDTVAVLHKFIAVSIAPPGSAMLTPGTTIHVTAKILYDIHNAGVIWGFGPGCGACGVLSDVTLDSVTYTAPATMPTPPTVTLTATSITDLGRSAAMAINIAAKAGLQEGDYAFLFNGWQLHFSGGYYTPSSVATAGHFHADANGNITDGVEDVNLASGVLQAVPFTGSYSVGTDHRGSFTIQTAQGTAAYRMTVDSSGNKAKFIKYDGLPTDEPISGSGYFELQDKTAFSLHALAGSYAMGMSGILQEWDRMAAAGRFTADAAGALNSGTMDAAVANYAGTSPQTNYLNSTLTGSWNAPSSGTGRGTASFSVTPPLGGATGTFNFAYYVIASEKILLMQKDTRSSVVSVLSGEARRQEGTFSKVTLDSPVVFSMVGVNREAYAPPMLNVAIGRMAPDGLGNIPGIMDQNDKGSVTLDKAFAGSYLVDPGGRTTINLDLGTGNTATHVAYLFGPREGFLLQTSGKDVLFGTMKPQESGPFTAGSVSGTFLTNTGMPTGESAKNYSGLTRFYGGNGASAALDCTNWEELHFGAFTGTYTVAGNGRGTLTFNGPLEMVFWVISPRELVGIATVSPSDYEPVLLEFEE